MEGTKMQCPKCQFENLGDVNFCVECGGKLEIICPKCGYCNSISYKFCGGCGHKLDDPLETPPKDLSFDEKLTEIQRYLPKGLTEKILSQRDKIEGERKHVTVMFCDLVGYTQLTEKLGPEKTYLLMDDIYGLLIHEVHRFEGTVNEMTGDGLIALFGAPIALEDASQRAVRSALSIQKAIARKAAEIGIQLSMRVGIHTGNVVLGTLGNDLRIEFKAVGDTVNLTARLQQLAEPGSTFVSDKIYQLTEGLFRFENLGEQFVKGKSQPISVYRVLGSGTRKNLFEVRAERGLTRFIGREREIEILWDCFERVQSGKGQAVSIVSEAGLGKSRLLFEFRKLLAKEEVTFLEGRCVSFGKNTPYLPIIEILQNNFQIELKDGSKEIQDKIIKGCRQLNITADNGENHISPYLFELLSIENGFDTLMDIEPEVKRRTTFEVLKDLCLRGSLIRPVVIAVEDLHWIDQTSEEYIKMLIDHIPGVRVFLIFTFRSNYMPPWGGKSYYSQITLNRLSNRESRAIISSILDSDEISDNLADLLFDKSEGVPFFIEEFTRLLQDSDNIVKTKRESALASNSISLNIPGTLQDLIMSRVDRLPAQAKEILQIGSAIENEFSGELIKEVLGISKMDLFSRVSHLMEAELIYEKGGSQATYIFQHALTRDIVYNSQLEIKRSEYHLAIGKAIEKIYSDRLEEHYDILALHFTIGNDSKKAYQYHFLAGDRAVASYANREALEHFQEAWRLINNVDSNRELTEKKFSTAVKLAEVMEPLGLFEPTLSLLEEIVNTSDKNDSPGNVEAFYWLGNTYGNLGRYDEARNCLRKCLELSQKAGNVKIEGYVHNYLAQLDWFQGYLVRALDHNKLAIKCLHQIGDYNRLAWAHVFHGLSCELRQIDEWKEFVEKGEYWVERTGNEKVKCLLYSLKCRMAVISGQYSAALENGLEGIKLTEKIGEGIQGSFLFAHAGLGAFYTGKSDLALDLLNQGLKKGGKIGHPLGINYLSLILAEVLLRLGKIEEATNYANQVLSFFQLLDLGLYLQSALQLNAELLTHKIPQDEEQIDSMMVQALRMVDRRASPWAKLDYFIAKARIELRRERPDTAEDYLSKARLLFSEIGPKNKTDIFCSIEKALRESRKIGGKNVC
jgi:class 3 adenylate cyclase/tetratricopeptide (TPR) repeat protein